MIDNEATVAVPVSLLADLQMAMHADDQPRITQFARAIVDVATIPKPIPGRLRVVDLDAIGPRYIANDGKHMVWVEDLDTAADVMTLIEQAEADAIQEDEWSKYLSAYITRLRNAIEEATR